MPPQRRKIVPPNTTSKARKKVAGSNRRTEPDAVASDAATPDTTATSDSTTPVDLSKAAKPDAAAPEPEAPAEPPAPAEPAALAEPAAPAEPAASEAPAARTSWTPVVAVGVAAVVFGAVAVVAALKPGADVDNSAWVDQNATSEVTAAATDALKTLYTYSDATIDEDFDKARAVLNPDMLAEFDRVADTTKSAVRQTQTATQADISDIGVTRLEPDHAEIVALLNVSATQAGVAQGNAEGPIVVNMEKTDGKWILSAISDQ
ncbi:MULTISPECIES: hypothetical protein [Rhodococcus]|uniref:Mce-associated membrane protein n=1 Tax=Rhodococcoides kyotonense TaxID=398843 RepID=A0A177YB22_9NOCA|nr:MULTISPECIES: hypothetical protein [Rhodococcus]NIL74368.1 hypothetical protein [Rhodococcus sp. B10]OAK52399.1 hypothetical protein A3K89_06040 [Rhodococcus kyotonensis]